MEITPLRLAKSALLPGGLALWGLLLVSCAVVGRTANGPAKIAGSEFVGSKQCAQCHSEEFNNFARSTHGKLILADSKLGDSRCEACHGPGARHVAAGGGPGTIIDPRSDPRTCFQCHPNSRGNMSAPCWDSECHEKVHR
ncbi:MAG: hypothetical protein ABSA05_08085 [Opitutaceae bacterium]